MIWTPDPSPENITKSIKIYDVDISYTRWPRYVDPSDGILEEYPEGNPEFVSLVNLRTYKNREGDNYRTRTGRTSGKNISFIDFPYEIRTLRRKYEVLQYNTGDKYITTKEKWNKLVTSKSKISQSQLRLMDLGETLENCNDKINNIDIKNIPFETSL
jgi:hypothetical protein